MLKGRLKSKDSISTFEKVKKVKRVNKYEFHLAAVFAVILGIVFYLLVPLLVINLSFLIVLESGSELLVMMNAVAALLILQSPMSACEDGRIARLAACRGSVERRN